MNHPVGNLSPLRSQGKNVPTHISASTVSTSWRTLSSSQPPAPPNSTMSQPSCSDSTYLPTANRGITWLYCVAYESISQNKRDIKSVPIINPVLDSACPFIAYVYCFCLLALIHPYFSINLDFWGLSLTKISSNAFLMGTSYFGTSSQPKSLYPGFFLYY